MRIKSESDILKLMSSIRAGYLDRSGVIYRGIDNNLNNRYVLQTGSELIKSKYGISFDQVELMRELFHKIGFNVTTYAIINDNKEIHSFLVYTKNNKYCWIENYWLHFRGIHEYDSLNDLLNDITFKFIDSVNNVNLNNIKVFEYILDNPKYNFIELINYLKKQVEIIII